MLFSFFIWFFCLYIVICNVVQKSCSHLLEVSIKLNNVSGKQCSKTIFSINEICIYRQLNCSKCLSSLYITFRCAHEENYFCFSKIIKMLGKKILSNVSSDTGKTVINYEVLIMFCVSLWAMNKKYA